MAFPQWKLREDGNYDLYEEDGDFIGVYEPSTSGLSEGTVHYKSGKKGKVSATSEGGVEVSSEYGGKPWATYEPKTGTNQYSTSGALRKGGLAKPSKMEFKRKYEQRTQPDRGGGGGGGIDTSGMSRKGKIAAGTVGGAAAAGALAGMIVKGVRDKKRARGEPVGRKEKRAARAKAEMDAVDRAAPYFSNQSLLDMTPSQRLEGVKQNLALTEEREKRTTPQDRKAYDEWYRGANQAYFENRKTGGFADRLHPDIVERYERTYGETYQEAMQRPEWKGLKTTRERHDFVQGEALHRMGPEGETIGAEYDKWRSDVNKERKEYHLPPISQTGTMNTNGTMLDPTMPQGVRNKAAKRTMNVLGSMVNRRSA